MRLFAALADPFLHPWDERFHALVSRNLMHSPFKPMLRAFPITENFDPNAWCCNHIWLHKQPLFMWQMALSMKIFGVSEIALRLPGVIMGTVLILLLYRITYIFTNSNIQVSLLAAILISFSNFHLQLISGIHGMDHNDLALGFYVLASIWAFVEYLKSPKWYWVVLIGVFSGAAILNKWLLGLLVFLGWGVHIVLRYKSDSFKRDIFNFIMALLVCVVVFAPWQIYILHTFPQQANYVFEFNKRHITEVLEGHQGSVFYYLKNFGGLMGEFLYLLIPVGVYLYTRSEKYNKNLCIALIVQIIFVISFFSFIVKTKVDTYIFFIVPLCFIFIAYALSHILNLIKKASRKAIMRKAIIIIVVIFLELNPIMIINYFSTSNKDRNENIYNAKIYRNLKKYIPA